MLLITRKLLALVLLLTLSGGQWSALQGVAWASMLAQNLQTDSLKKAVAETLDGQHPCSLCRAIDASKKSEKKTESVPPIKLEFTPQEPAADVSAEKTSAIVPTSEPLVAAERNPPATPPPRAWLV